MRLEQISERIRDHLTNQKKQAKNGCACAYRGSNGTMCAVGCLIDDAHYYADLEQLGCRTEPVMDAVSASLGIAAGVGSRLAQMLREWQRYHDSDEYARWCWTSEGFSPASVHERVVMHNALRTEQ